MRRLKDGVTPTVFHWTEEETATSLERKAWSEKREQQRMQQINDILLASRRSETLTEHDIVIGCEEEAMDVTDYDSSCTGTSTSQAVQTDPGPIMVDSQTGTDPLHVPRFSVSDFKDNRRAIQFYTGLESYSVCLAWRGYKPTELFIWNIPFNPRRSAVLTWY